MSDEYNHWTMSDEYNGWTNKETWLVKLWLDQDEPGHEERFRQAQMARAQKDGKHLLAERLKQEHQTAASLKLQSATVFADLLNAALGRVNWAEVAEALIADAK